MMKKLLASALLVGTCAASPADASVLLKLVNAPVTPQTFFVLPFEATTSMTMVTLGGYQLPSYIQATQVALAAGASGGNLLGEMWEFSPAPTDEKFGFYTDQFNDTAHGTATNAVEFGSIVVGAYDYYSQYIPTTPGQQYTLSFLYTQDYTGPNAFVAQFNEALVQDVPEPSSWAMLILGLGMTGAALRRRQFKSQARLSLS